MSRRQLEVHQSVWRAKPELSTIYGVWFDSLLGRARRGARVLEIGAGPGLLADHARSRRPDLRWISSDVVETPWNGLVADALRLPLRDGSVDAVMALDLIHHLARPAEFFKEAARVLEPNGLLCAIEPWITPLSYPIYRWVHPEGCTLDLDPWDPFGVAESRKKEPLRGDNACAWRLARTTAAPRWHALGFEAPRVTLFNGFAYLASLGFRRNSLLPGRFAAPLLWLDQHSSRLARFLSLRALLEWRRHRAAGDGRD
jgi:SAM-dependent methyltransferase